MSDLGPFSNYRLTARLELRNKIGVFASVTALLARSKASLGAVDIVNVSRDKMVRDVTFDVAGEAHGERVIEKLRKLRGVHIVSVSDRIFLFHLGGKIEVHSRYPVTTRNRLSMIYTPGVARVSQAIAQDPAKVYNLTMKSNSVAIVTDGSAVLGLGNIGSQAAVPVMEGKAVLFKEFANVNAYPICLATQDPEEIIKTVCHIAPAFGGINLEDISAPRCFEIEDKLKALLDIPVMHDDQHGTAIVILAALKNALKITGKRIEDVKIVVNGLGAAGIACCRILLAAGARRLIGADRQGVVLYGAPRELKMMRRSLYSCIHWSKPRMKLREALAGADVFIGVSAGNVLKPGDLGCMKKNRIVFAMANPDPEVEPHKAMRLCRIFATGRSDFPNQINNALAFPAVFRGALDVRASVINESMKLAAAEALAGLIGRDQLNEEYIIPSIFDKRIVERVSAAVASAAMESGVARRKTQPGKSAEQNRS
ncbi:MAG: malate dehydrogenase [Omnitrophica bacterium GWA2_52_8]|nr:MAG: malate dehydrogenase [Omnitrophica bacterium GWA2_52_8]